MLVKNRIHLKSLEMSNRVPHQHQQVLDLTFFFFKTSKNEVISIVTKKNQQFMFQHIHDLLQIWSKKVKSGGNDSLQTKTRNRMP